MMNTQKNTPDLSHVALPLAKAKKMHEMGYRFVGKHSAIKICEWTREAIRGRNVCYKCKFYGIATNRCIQMSPAVQFCNFNCKHCWRSLSYTLPKKNFQWDEPDFVLDGCITEQKKILQGFWGGDCDKKKLKEAMEPKQVAISLSGEPCFYPFLPELIDEIIKRKMTAFLVTNGTLPEMIRKLACHQPTNLYVTLPAPDKEHYMKECAPMIKDGWERIMETLALLKNFSCATVVRLTLNRKHNFFAPEKYAELLEKYQPMFVECKSYMAIGGARQKLGPEAMIKHDEIKSFAEQIEKNSSFKIIDEKEDSRVVLMKK